MISPTVGFDRSLSYPLSLQSFRLNRSLPSITLPYSLDPHLACATDSPIRQPGPLAAALWLICWAILLSEPPLELISAIARSVAPCLGHAGLLAVPDSPAPLRRNALMLPHGVHCFQHRRAGIVGGCFIGALLMALVANYAGVLAPKFALVSNIAQMTQLVDDRAH